MRVYLQLPALDVEQNQGEAGPQAEEAKNLGGKRIKYFIY